MAFGLVFDIQRFQQGDGPGVRSTVYLKTCPLQSASAQGVGDRLPMPPESLRDSLCVACGACADVCPAHKSALDGQKRPNASELCHVCGACAGICASSMLRLEGVDRHSDDVIEEVARDAAYFARSGGGVTISGGEPLAQQHFAAGLLEEARKRGLHTCLDTTGFALPSTLDAVLPFVNLFLFEYRATGEALHWQLAGVSRVPVVIAFEHLCDAGARIHLRCPLIPGVNDSAEHLAAIAELATRKSVEHVEIIACRSMAAAKARRFGFPPPDGGAGAPDEKTMTRHLADLRRLGCAKARLA